MGTITIKNLIGGSINIVTGGVVHLKDGFQHAILTEAH